MRSDRSGLIRINCGGRSTLGVNQHGVCREGHRSRSSLCHAYRAHRYPTESTLALALGRLFRAVYRDNARRDHPGVVALGAAPAIIDGLGVMAAGPSPLGVDVATADAADERLVLGCLGHGYALLPGCDCGQPLQCARS